MSNIVKTKSFLFATRVVKLCKFLRKTKQELVMSKQLLRSGTSIGANVAESQYAQSKADFIAKLSIALKESAETIYWLQLLHETGYLNFKEYESISADCKELQRLLAAIVKSCKNNC